MIRINPNALPPRTGEPLLAVRPVKEAPDTQPESSVGETWRWYTSTGYPLAYVYFFRSGGEYRADVSNEAPGVGLYGQILGGALPPLPRTDPQFDWENDRVSYEMITAEVEATLREYGWAFFDRDAAVSA